MGDYPKDLVSINRGLPLQLLKETYDANRAIFIKYRAMKKKHMSKFRIIGLMHEAQMAAISNKVEDDELCEKD